MLSRRDQAGAWPGARDPAAARFRAESSPAPRFPGIMPFPDSVPLGPQTIVVLPARVDLVLYQGDDFTLRVDVSDDQGYPYDLSGAVPESHIRERVEDAYLAGVFEATIADSVLFLHLTPVVSSGLPLQAVWDAQITRDAGARVTTLVAGTITLVPEVTR